MPDVIKLTFVRPHRLSQHNQTPSKSVPAYSAASGKTDQHFLEKVFQKLGQQEQECFHDGGKITTGQGNPELTLEVERDNSDLWEFSHNVLLFGFGLRNNTNTISEGILFTSAQVSCYLRCQINYW